MGHVQHLQLALFVFDLTISTVAQTAVNCQNFKFVIDESVVFNHILENHVFHRLTVSSALQCHAKCKDDCLCVSMNYFPQSEENNCELNDANKYMEPAAMTWRQGGNYHDLVRTYTVKGGEKYIPGKHRCINRCCRPNPCLNGGICQEICDTHTVRFSCDCVDKYAGQRCGKIQHPKSCKDIAKNGASTSGEYDIFDSNNETFSVNCDLQSEPGFVWTLVQSFSLNNSNTFKNKGFGINFEIKNDKRDMDWNRYRLSLSQMQSLANHSTHLRATCNFPTDGLRYTDYARAKLAGHDIFGNWSRCQIYEYVNIRGINCSSCTALTKQQDDAAWRIRSYESLEKCEFDGEAGAVEHENNFGQYRNAKINPNHRCVSSKASTTQHWFGIKNDL
ncbi:uncharacterized protein LOC111333086 [Stylophora pistillata]|nr:uncharacterized protein LOC111333086 [Stylophora pistillata]XP_022794341.1 uncharacterized protein LOC111333086 [Stylophora pistillata]